MWPLGRTPPRCSQAPGGKGASGLGAQGAVGWEWVGGPAEARGAMDCRAGKSKLLVKASAAEDTGALELSKESGLRWAFCVRSVCICSCSVSGSTPMHASSVRRPVVGSVRGSVSGPVSGALFGTGVHVSSAVEFCRSLTFEFAACS